MVVPVVGKLVIFGVRLNSVHSVASMMNVMRVMSSVLRDMYQV